MAAPVTPLPTANWKAWYESRLVSEEQAAQQVQRGDHIFTPIGSAGRTMSLLAALGPRLDEVAPISVTNGMPPDPSWFGPDYAGKVRFNVLFGTVANRDAVNGFAADYSPWMVFGAHKAFEEGRPGAPSLDVAVVAVSPPNSHGYCNFGHSLWDGKRAALLARTTIAIVTDTLPLTYGDTWIHVSDIDWFVPSAAPMAALSYPGPTPLDLQIAANIAPLVRDGDTLQVGTGTATAAVVSSGALDEKRDLGWFSELTVNGVVDLVRKGVITSKHMATHPGKVINTTAGNSAEDIEFIDNNPMFEFYGTEYVHHPGAIGRNDNLVAINQALSVDFTGQIAAGQLGGNVWSGTGGQFAYAMGAFMSKGGRSITVLPSTASGGTVSRIVPQFAPGQVVTVPRDIADIVVTEYGVAHLLNKTQRERAEELISVAHPDFRAELRKQAARCVGL